MKNSSRSADPVMTGLYLFKAVLLVLLYMLAADVSRNYIIITPQELAQKTEAAEQRGYAKAKAEKKTEQPSTNPEKEGNAP